tara:strand:+ start:695 stop:823 length:129 start_codon:yes stop_codon:yes gene_type:complete
MMKIENDENLKNQRDEIDDTNYDYDVWWHRICGTQHTHINIS